MTGADYWKYFKRSDHSARTRLMLMFARCLRVFNSVSSASPAAPSSPQRSSIPSARCFLYHRKSRLFFIFITCVPMWVACSLIVTPPPPSREDFLSSGGNMADRATHYSVGVQTDYRESETQTDPYSPAYVIRDGTTPSELLQLAAFTWGTRSPALAAQHHTV